MEETKGQDVALNMLEVFVNRWRHMPANVTSLCLEKGEGKRTGWKATLNFQWHEDRDRTKEKDKREVDQDLILIFLSGEASNR